MTTAEGPLATVAIPARLASSRLERKVLADIGGKTMLQRTYEVAVAAACGPVVILTDAPEVVQAARSFGAAVRMTDPALESGTARIASVVDEFVTEVVINLQGDAPIASPDVVARSAREAARVGAPVTLPVYRITNPEDVHDPDFTKVLRGHDGRVLYCSRHAVPYVRDVPPGEWPSVVPYWGPVGLYAYATDFLRSYPGLPSSRLEAVERLEQLRWLEAGIWIHSFEAEPMPGPSVNTSAQLERVRAIITERERATKP